MTTAPAARHDMTREAMRRLQTYLQCRLDRAGEGDMKLKQETVREIVAALRTVERETEPAGELHSRYWFDATRNLP